MAWSRDWKVFVFNKRETWRMHSVEESRRSTGGGNFLALDDQHLLWAGMSEVCLNSPGLVKVGIIVTAELMP